MEMKLMKIFTSNPELGNDVDGRLKVNASFQIGLLGSDPFADIVFFFFTRFPLIIKYICTNKHRF